jgi:hypothetical protein
VPHPPSQPRYTLFARLSIYENVDLDLADQVQTWFEATDNDPFADLPGYRGSMTLVDSDNARVVGIGFYATAGQAQEADAGESSFASAKAVSFEAFDPDNLAAAICAAVG